MFIINEKDVRAPLFTPKRRTLRGRDHTDGSQYLMREFKVNGGRLFSVRVECLVKEQGKMDISVKSILRLNSRLNFYLKVGSNTGRVFA